MRKELRGFGLIIMFFVIATVAYAATGTSDSFKSADSEATVFGGLATSTSFRNISAGQQIQGAATSDSFKSEIGVLYFEPPAEPEPEPEPTPTGGGGGFFKKEEPPVIPTPEPEPTEILKQVQDDKLVVEELTADIFQQVKEIPKKIIQIIFPPKKPELPPIEGVVKAVPPYALSGQWVLLPARAIREFALSPLPQNIRMLAQKFPEVKQTFQEVGVKKITDVSKLQDIALNLPGLSETVGAPTYPDLIGKLKQIPAFSKMTDLEIAKLSQETVAKEIERVALTSPKLAESLLPIVKLPPAHFALPSRIPLSQLSLEYKEKLPTEFVFARASGELIDMKTVLSLNEKGETEQRVFATAGKTLYLSVKPDGAARSVSGYLVYKGENEGIAALAPLARNDDAPSVIASGAKQSLEIEAKDLVASAIFAGPVTNPSPFAKGGAPQERGISSDVTFTTELVIAEFEYEDSDNDGIWTAEIQAPVVEGEYETITIIDYVDPVKGKQAVRLITVVDPEGYIYEQDGDRQIRVGGAIVSLYRLNPETSEYELWPAERYLQKNPQVTDVTGKYSFLTPEGTYYIRVEAPGYMVYEGKSFIVEEGRGVHFNIDLRAAMWWLKLIDWKWIMMLLLFLLVVYNYYRDFKLKHA